MNKFLWVLTYLNNRSKTYIWMQIDTNNNNNNNNDLHLNSLNTNRKKCVPFTTWFVHCRVCDAYKTACIVTIADSVHLYTGTRQRSHECDAQPSFQTRVCPLLSHVFKFKYNRTWLPRTPVINLGRDKIIIIYPGRSVLIERGTLRVNHRYPRVRVTCIIVPSWRNTYFKPKTLLYLRTYQPITMHEIRQNHGLFFKEIFKLIFCKENNWNYIVFSI